MTILVIGGAGYIGSHVCKALSKNGYHPITFDNLCNGHEWAVRYGPLFRGDLHSAYDLDAVFQLYEPEAVIHLASFINARESLENPYIYFHNNVSGTLSLLHAMVRHGVKKLVFSSTASLYGNPSYLPIDELHPQMPLNPYGKSKWMCEQLFQDFYDAHGLHSLCLRYFNAAGADLDGELGEAHTPETHLIPLVIETAMGKRPFLTINGIDHPTPDGTAVRDYIHVSDLADAHVRGVKWLNREEAPLALNLGAERGISIREIISAAERICGSRLQTKIGPRSPADPPVLIADSTLAREVLGWQTEFSSLDVIIESAWKWHRSRELAEISR